MQVREPERTFPAGWFQIGWSYEVARGEVRPLRFFGQDLVLCRYESGDIGLFDAYCPHMNAHIGHGGRTIGETLACPYHGWRFDRSGCNAHIPYSSRVSRSQGLRAWHVAELGGSVILAWYSPDGAGPQYDPPGEAELPGMGKPEYYPVGPDTARRYADLPMHIDFVTENTVDMSHFKFVHETPEIGTILELDPVDHRFHVRFSMPMKLYRPDGGGDIVDAVTEVTNWGLGLILARFSDGASLIQAQTPVDDTQCEILMTMVLPRNASGSDAPTGEQLARFKMACRQVENDMVIWTHRRPGAQAHLVAEEVVPFRTFTKWKRQFYTAQPVSGAETQRAVGSESEVGS
ncbi:Rieske 2Fe-2S domain-containing protein [Amycolatopsis sp. GM8]|uniref:Rieske 2Fe-2S domain-containing protein n=1 Tax=Amycolatopsis sp. GM8 TaxID=2896530 RepID=UPI001F3EBA86|nr:Rieske 2Fe-2S domain-containing protein [Amycolatopsis sp. GM8]